MSECKVPQDERVALVGNSGLRTVELACQLMACHGVGAPQVYVMDYSEYVITFWRHLKAFFYRLNDDRDFLNKFKKLLEANQKIIVQSGKGASESNDYYSDTVEALIKKYGFQNVKDLILNAVLIRQDWEDQESFKKLKVLIQRDHFQQTIVYASNILSLTNEIKAEKIANNIAILKPDYSVHENYAPFKHYPTACYISHDYTPAAILARMEKMISLEIDGFCFMRPEAQIDGKYRQMLSAISNMILRHNYNIDPMASFFFPDMILKMSGINVLMNSCYFEPSKYLTCCVFHLPFPKEHTEA